MEYDNNYLLPGGRCYQKDGERLEQAIYNCLPDQIKEKTLTNLKPTNNGNIIIEYDMIYFNNNNNTIISFEIKGLNQKTCNSVFRQKKLLTQVQKQKTFLESNIKKKDLTITCVLCFVTGNYNTQISQSFIDSLRKYCIVAIGKSPNNTIKCAIKQLTNLNLL